MQNTPMVMISKHSRKALLLLSTLLATGLTAQTASETKTEQLNGEDVVKLSPFEVSTERDSGYKASNSIAGTRSNTPIKDIALNIQVFTKDLVEDFAAADQTALERYNAAVTNGGADTLSENNIQQAYNSFLFRGFIQNWGIRDGIREYDPVDAQGLARVELVKGPAAALYGLAYPGGVMNSITKQADLHKNFVSLRLTGYDAGGYRATIDANFLGNAGDGKIAIRFNGANGVTEDKREHSKGNTRFTQTNLAYQPFKGTLVEFLVEDGWRQKPIGLGYYTYTPTAADITADPSKAGVGVSIPLQVARPDIPWTWNWANASNNRSLANRMYRGTITQAIGEDFHVTAYLQSSSRTQIDSDGWDDSGNSQNPAGWDTTFGTNGVFPTGWIRGAAANGSQDVIRRSYHWRDWSNRVHAMGATGVYKFEVASIKNTATIGAANWDERFRSFKGNQPGTSTKWFDLPVRSGVDTQAPIIPNDFFYDQAADSGAEHSQNLYYYANWQLNAIDNRLKLNFAVNHTRIKDLQWPNNAAANHAPLTDISQNSPMIGGMFDITKEISVFAVHSTSLFPNTTKNDFGVQLPSIVGKSNEVGVKTELLNGKISGTASYYSIVQTGGNQRDPSAVNRNKTLWDGYSSAQRAAFFPGITRREDLLDATGNKGDQVPGAEQTSKGFEFDLAIQPTKSLQIMLSYAHNKQETSKALDTSGVTVVDATHTTTDVGLTSLHQTTGGHIPNQLSLLGKYTFNEGAAKGLSLGLGFQRADKALQGYTDMSTTVVSPANSSGVINTTVTHRYVAQYNPSTTNVDFFTSYKFKAFGLNQVVQFNAKNLTKQAGYIGWKPTGNAAVLATERYEVPTYITYSLTWGLDF